MFKLTGWSIRRTFKLAMATALFTMAIAGISPASAQTQSVAVAGISPASAQTRSASGYPPVVGITYDQCSAPVVTVFTPSGPLRVDKGETQWFRVPFSTKERRIFWSCGYTPEATWLPPFTNEVQIYRQIPSHGRRITWTSFFAYKDL